ncbi:RHS repeat-associated core domain-containing protein, partial [Chitiniphilus shinanonensis]|uniref:RHS repeat-associated core domain-containing protein n=1 Tax=Chitiniphilus shinanonensis TaxID=553088 RepID=UPI003342C906
YIQSDPIGLAGGINTYGYVEGNPAKSADPSGLHPAVAAALWRCAGGAGSALTTAYAKSWFEKMWEDGEMCSPWNPDIPKPNSCEVTRTLLMGCVAGQIGSYWGGF